MRYDFRYNERIQKTEFCCTACLTQDLIETLQFTRKYESIELYAHADVIAEVLRNLLNVEVNDEIFTLGMIDFDGQGDDYVSEFVLTINDDNQVWIEPAWREVNGEWKLFDSDALVTYINADYNSKILSKLEKDKNKVLIFDFEE